MVRGVPLFLVPSTQFSCSGRGAHASSFPPETIVEMSTGDTGRVERMTARSWSLRHASRRRSGVPLHGAGMKARMVASTSPMTLLRKEMALGRAEGQLAIAEPRSWEAKPQFAS